MLQKTPLLALVLSFCAVADAMALNAVPDDPMQREVAPGITRQMYEHVRAQMEAEIARAEQEKQAAEEQQKTGRILSPYSKDTSATGLDNQEQKLYENRQEQAVRDYVQKVMDHERAFSEEHKPRANTQKVNKQVYQKPQQNAVPVPDSIPEQKMVAPVPAPIVATPESHENKSNLAEVYLISEQAKAYNLKHSEETASIENVQIFIDQENIKLSDAVEEIVSKTQSYAGHWDVKWRLSPENIEIKDLMVNLTAEATFSEFMDYLIERIQNMTGIQLFVKKFETSRVIVISDVY